MRKKDRMDNSSKPRTPLAWKAGQVAGKVTKTTTESPKRISGAFKKMVRDAKGGFATSQSQPEI